MDPRHVTEDFAVSPQIAPDDLAEIARLGYRAVICNRPDNEDPGQSDYDTIAAAAREAGLDARCIPVASGTVTEEAVRNFRDALEEMPGPVLAYCRSGTRCTMLWSLAQLGRMDADRILSAAAQAGYDMSAILRQAGAGRPGPS